MKKCGSDHDFLLAKGGMVLKVGGMLQHGALVTTESGNPRLVGIERATEIFGDGQLVDFVGSNRSIFVV